MIGRDIPWASFKSFVDDRLLSVQWVDLNNTYYMAAIDGPFNFKCSIYKDGGADQLEFEASYKDLGNRSPKTEVVSQTEKNDKTLKLASLQGEYDEETKLCVLSMLIPETFNGVDPDVSNGRFVAGGYAFQNGFDFGDRITKVEVVDEDNIFGYGAGTVIKGYHDTHVVEEDAGWRLYPTHQGGGEIEIDPIGGYGFIPSGLYLRLTFKKTNASTATKVAADIWWARRE